MPGSSARFAPRRGRAALWGTPSDFRGIIARPVRRVCVGCPAPISDPAFGALCQTNRSLDRHPGAEMSSDEQKGIPPVIMRPGKYVRLSPVRVFVLLALL